MRPDKKIAVWLGSESETLRDSYEAAVRLLDDTAFPGRVQIICHSGRDMHRCPGRTGVAKRRRADTGAVLNELEPQ